VAQVVHSCVTPLLYCTDLIITHRSALMDVLIFYALPAAWVALLLLCVHSGAELVGTLDLPLIGFAGALVANSLPVGPGVVYLPLLVKLVEHDSLHASVEFTHAAVSIGAGVWGLLVWYRRDLQLQAASAARGRDARPLIMWSMLWNTVPASWLGAAVGLLGEPELPNRVIARGFSLFCLLLAGYLLLQLSSAVRSQQSRAELAYARGLQGVAPGSAAARRIARHNGSSLVWLPSTLDWCSDSAHWLWEQLEQPLARAVGAARVLDLTDWSWLQWSFLMRSGGGLSTGGGRRAHEPAVPAAVEDEEGGQAAADAASVPAVAAEQEQEGEASMQVTSDPIQLTLQWYRWVFVSFLAGLLLLPNIGAGPSLLTFTYMRVLGHDSRQAMVTAVVTGGICCWAPFFIHAVVLRDMAPHVWAEIAMALPGIAVGAWVAPKASDWMGPLLLEASMALFLLFTAVLFAL
jgi:uncharacterized membrane protein YfcA